MLHCGAPNIIILSYQAIACKRILNEYPKNSKVLQTFITTAKELVSTLRAYMGTFKVMDKLATDGNPEYRGERIPEQVRDQAQGPTATRGRRGL